MLKLQNKHHHHHHAPMEEIFCFDAEDEEFFSKKSKSTSDFQTISTEENVGKNIHESYSSPNFDASRFPNFENEEILSIRPKKNFSFDIMHQEKWNPQNNKSTCFDLSSMFQNISLTNHSQGSSSPSQYGYCVSFEEMTHTIEGLRIHLRSCFTCGVHWHEDQASLDCRECDGYALSRPCPDCDGKCEATWTRNLDQSHSLGKAKWIGTCSVMEGLTSA